MAPRICRESMLGCWAVAAVKRQKRLHNKKSFMRVAILLLESSSIPCSTARFENSRVRAPLPEFGERRRFKAYLSQGGQDVRRERGDQVRRQPGAASPAPHE